MHGRLKIKTTAEQEAEKNKEREKKKEKYTQGINVVMAKRKVPGYDEVAMNVTASLLSANPDVQSLWNYRRAMLLAKKRSVSEDSISEFQKLLLQELDVTEASLLKNPKSYGAWHHRAWALTQCPTPPWETEMELCDKYLSLDGRNFHCWDHRRFVVEECKQSLMDELDYTLKLIKENFSNYSAWHYRSCLLPKLYPPTPGSGLPIENSIFIEELNRVVTAVFTDPSDQSPWFFLRWLISIQPTPRIVQLGIMPLDEKMFVLVTFSTSASENDLNTLKIKTDDTYIDGNWVPLDSEQKVWKLPISCNTVSIIRNGTPVADFETSKAPVSKWIVKSCYDSYDDLPVNIKKNLSELVENCLQLDDIDPDNKWVLLTLVDLMNGLNSLKYLKQINEYLVKLQRIDPLRSSYYEDKRSSINFAKGLQESITNQSTSLIIPSQELSYIDKPQYLLFMKHINLSNNNLKSIDWSKYLLNCFDPILDGNPVVPLVKKLQKLVL